RVMFEVSDTGVGIDASEQACLFDAFTQTDSGRNKTGGTGLGLAISKSIMLAMNGDIGVHSEEGEGSQFWFSLPLEAGEKIETKVPVIEACIRAKVLLIEDNPVNCIVAEGFLHNLGHEVVIATTGQEARAIFKEQDFDIALVDINLPDCDGIELIQYLKDDLRVLNSSAEIQRSEPPMIAVSAHVFNEEVEEYLASGFDGFLPKPLEKEALAKLVNSQLAEHELLLPQPDPNDRICSAQNGEIDSVHQPIDRPQIVQEKEEADVLIIDVKVIEGDLAILGKEKMQTIVGLFEQSSRETLNELVDASDSNDSRAIKSLAHKLKGSAGSLGLLALFDVCKNIEMSSNPLSQYSDSAEHLTELVKDSLAALQQHV
ncbi:response regulator, partial [Vibrio sp. 10N.261.45.A7]